MTKLRVLYLDETADWEPSPLVSVCGRILSVYLYDEATVTHYCELAPSYDCLLVGYLAERAISDEQQQMLMESMDNSDIMHAYHCSSIDQLPRIRLRPHWNKIDPFPAIPNNRGWAGCTCRLPGKSHPDHETAIEEGREYMSMNGFTTT